jgi:light-regulated signal transduction histidine kinase (bacteriophytochrome)
MGVFITLVFLGAARVVFSFISFNPIVFVMAAVIAASWLYGRGPGVVSAVISALLARPLFFPNAAFRFDWSDLFRVAMFIGLSAVISFLVGSRRRAEAAMKKVNDELERRVSERTAELNEANRELRLANRELEKTNQALRRANSDLEQFAYSASHDLQEPLRNVAVYSQLLTRRYAAALDEQGLEFLGVVNTGARRMETLVRDLLSYTQAGRREERGAIEAIDADEVLNRVLQDLGPAVEEAGAIVVNHGLPRVRVEEVHFRQLMQNLVGNAVKYRGERPPRIEVSAARLGEQWQFTVKDNGIGIEAQHLHKVFGIFKRLHGQSQYPGTGMGLAICQRLVENYDGRIWVESEPGTGSTFHFTIPVEGADIGGDAGESSVRTQAAR